MALTNFALQALVSNMFGDVATGMPSSWYLGFSWTTPSQVKGSGTPYWNFTEPTTGTGGYGRLLIGNNTTNFGAIASEPASGYAIQNNAVFTFTASSGAWSTGATPLTFAGVWDALTGGNLWGYGALLPTVVVNQAGVAPTFTVGQFVSTFSSS